MSVILSKKPASVCFAADGVSYSIEESSPTSNTPISFKFKLGVIDDSTAYGYVYKYIELLCHPIKGDQDENIFDIDLTDIIQAYTRRYHIPNLSDAEIFGYVTVQLTHIDGNASSLDNTEHICLPGTSGGLTLTGVMPADKHPFLLARGKEEGSLHFYRSELEAMRCIFAYISNEYHDYNIDTDIRDATQQDYDHLMLNIPSCFNLFGIWLLNANGVQIQISADANILLLYYHWYETFLINSISIQDDPDTDEMCLIRWTNSMGAPEALLFTGELQDISEVEKPELYISNQNIRSTERKMQRGMVTTKYSLQTGYLTPAQIIALRDMLTSEEVEMQINGEWIPVSVTADPKHAVHQREPETFELTIEVLEQTRYHTPNRTVRPLPNTRAALLQDNSGNLILDNNSNTIEENG